MLPNLNFSDFSDYRELSNSSTVEGLKIPSCEINESEIINFSAILETFESSPSLFCRFKNIPCFKIKPTPYIISE